MLLARKLIFAVLIGILLVVVAYDYSMVSDNLADYQARVAEDVASLGQGLSISLAQVARDSGPDAAQKLMARRNEGSRTKARWLALDVPATDPRAIVLPADLIARLRKGQPARLLTGSGATARLSVYRPFFDQPKVHDVVEVSESLAPIQKKMRHQLIGILIKSILILLLGTGYTFGLGLRLVARPVQQLVAQARRIGGGNLTQRLRLSGHDELSELAQEMNVMCDRLADARDHVAAESVAKLSAVEQLRHADRLATVGQLASGVAHELGTPLNVVAGHAKMIATDPALPSQCREDAHLIAEQAARMTAIIRQLLDFARRSKPRLDVGELGAIAERTVKMLAHLALQHRVELRMLPVDFSTQVQMDAAHLQQAVTNLVLNAIQAMPNGGVVELALAEVQATKPGSQAEPRSYVQLTIDDQGTGIVAENLLRIFEPFFTTKEVGEGTGLGLSVCYGIVSDHDGFIAVDSTVGKGSRFAIFLPAVPGIGEKFGA